MKNKVGYFFRRFASEYKMYVGKSFLLAPLYFIDYLFALLFRGASVNDYFAFGFYKLRCNGRNEYITYRRYHRIMRKCNRKDKIEVFRDKRLFNKVYSDFLQREYLDLDSTSKETFVRFFREKQVVFVKESHGFRGNSVRVFKAGETDPEDLYDQLTRDRNAHYVVEERIGQHPDLAAFHPSSVNTIRIVTLYDDARDKVHFMFAKIRIGNHGAYLDNTHAGGISGNIDLETGIICHPGYSVQTQEEFLVHPYSGKMIVGFRIPYWKECKAFVEKAARITPQIRYVGWDVVILPDGGFALIEANDNADHDGQQIRNKGMWKEYKSIIKDFK